MTLFPDPDAPSVHARESAAPPRPAWRGPSAWAALPDALTAAGFLAVWWHPFVFGVLSETVDCAETRRGCGERKTEDQRGESRGNSS